MARHIGHGTTLSIDIAGGTSWTAIGQILSITPPALSREEINITTLDDTIQYKLPSDPEDVGELTFELAWDVNATNPTILETATLGRNIVATWKITYPSSTSSKVATFTGWIKNFTPQEVSGKDAIKLQITVVLLTAITWT